MREKIAKNRNTILMVLGILILVTFNIGMRYLATRPRYKTLPEVTLRNKESNKSGYAVMIPNESGNGYVEYTSADGKWPSEEEGYAFKEAKCIDNNGALVQNAVTFTDGKVTLTTSQTVYCTLYFDKKPETIKILRKNDPQNKLSSETVGGMYRFQGKNTDTINNYICFGTDNKEECTNESTGYDKYMYRIIGITEDGQLYLIKMKGVEEGNNRTFSWGYDQWPNSYVYQMLNGTYSNGNIFINNKRYEYMVEGNDWYNKIEYHNWKYGELSGTDTSNNGLKVYEIENVWSADVPAKIGLMYLHDYYLAYDNNRNWNSDYDSSNWIHFINNKNTTGASQELTIAFAGKHDTSASACDSPSPDGPSYSSSHGFSNNYEKVTSVEERRDENHLEVEVSFLVSGINHYWIVSSSGRVSSSYLTYCGSGGLARPTFYVSSSVTIKDGTGSITDPYILNVQE